MANPVVINRAIARIFLVVIGIVCVGLLIWYFVTKIVLTYCEKKLFSDREKLLKFDAEGREFSKILRSLKLCRSRNKNEQTNLFFYPDISEILETWNRNSSFKYFRVVRIEKKIVCSFLGEVTVRQFLFRDLLIFSNSQNEPTISD